MRSMYAVNTLRYDEKLCIGCGMCSTVCPHGVFAQNDHVLSLIHISEPTRPY